MAVLDGRIERALSRIREELDRFKMSNERLERRLVTPDIEATDGFGVGGPLIRSLARKVLGWLGRRQDSWIRSGRSAAEHVDE